MTEISSELRALMVRARRSKGLSQAALASRAGVSAIWLRQIETGNPRAASASADTLGTICYELGVDSVILQALGFPDIARAVDACVMLNEKAIPDHLIDARAPRSAEDHIRRTPGITRRERKLLVDTLYAIRGKQPA